MKIKTIKAENDLEYFIIYQVNGVNEYGERVDIDKYLKQDAAKDYLNYCKENYSEMYSSLYISEEIVWVK